MINSAAVPLAHAKSELSLFRLYTLRVFYLVLAGGLGAWIWPHVLHHTSEYAIAYGPQVALLAGIGATALLGLRYPVRMIPLLLFELIWKAIYLAAFALPLALKHQVTEAAASDITSIAMIVLFVPLIPWRYVLREFVLARGDRWR